MTLREMFAEPNLQIDDVIEVISDYAHDVCTFMNGFHNSDAAKITNKWNIITSDILKSFDLWRGSNVSPSILIVSNNERVKTGINFELDKLKEKLQSLSTVMADPTSGNVSVSSDIVQSKIEKVQSTLIQLSGNPVAVGYQVLLKTIKKHLESFYPEVERYLFLASALNYDKEETLYNRDADTTGSGSMLIDDIVRELQGMDADDLHSVLNFVLNTKQNSSKISSFQKARESLGASIVNSSPSGIPKRSEGFGEGLVSASLHSFSG